MKKIYISANDATIRLKSDGNNKTAFRVQSFDLDNIDDQQTLTNLFQHHVYSNNKFGSPLLSESKQGYTGHGESKNYEGIYGIMLDIDDGNLSIEEAREKFKEYVHIIHTTSGHQMDKPDKGGIQDRFRVYLPFKAQHGEEAYFTTRKEGIEFYKYLKRVFRESDPLVFERGRKLFPFAGENVSKYEIYFNTKGEFFSVSDDDIRTASNGQTFSEEETKPKNRNRNPGNSPEDNTRYNVSTGEAYYSPTGEEYLMPNEVIQVRVDGEFVVMPFQKLKEYMEINSLEKVITYCNHCDDRNSETPSGWIYKDYRGFYIAQCSHCESEIGKSYQWREYPISGAMFAMNKKLYEIKIRSADHIGPHEISRDEWKSKKEADFASQYLRKNRYFLMDNFTINYKSAPCMNTDIPSYFLNFSRNEINIEYPMIEERMRDNQFIDDYIDRIFGEHSSFIKDWLALYTYTDYESLPVIILVGDRATGKNTFVEMVSKIYPQLWSHWNGDQEAFNDYYTKKLLWIDENAFGDKKSQYNQIKHITGNEWVTVNEKYKPRYRVRNNIKVILTTNDVKPLAVKAEEAPTSPEDNNFFFFKMPKIDGDSRNRNIKNELEERIGHYCRTELKDRYDRVIDNPDLSCRYIIPCPITEFGKEIYVTSKTDLDLVSETLAEMVVNGFTNQYTHEIYGGNSHIKYSEIAEIARQNGILRGKYTVKHFISGLQKQRVISIEQERKNSLRLGYKIIMQPSDLP